MRDPKAGGSKGVVVVVVRFLMRRPGLVGGALVGLTLMAFGGVARLTLDPASDHLLLRHTASYRIYQDFLATFGSDAVILVALHDPAGSILTPDGLAAVRELTHALETLPEVASVISLTTIPDVTRLRLTPFGVSAPRLITGASLSQAQRDAMQQSRLLVGTVLGRDAQTAGLLVVPHKTIMASAGWTSWIATVRDIAAQHALRGRQTFVAGTPLEKMDVTAYLERDQRLLIPLVFLVLLGMTWYYYRSLRLAFLPLVCVVLALIWTMGLVGYSGVPLNLITALLPPVVMVVSVSSAIHLINQFCYEVGSGKQVGVAVEAAIGHVTVPCFLASLTTALGFFSLLASPVPALQEFALFAGLGVLLSFVATLTVVPVVLARCTWGPLEAFDHRQQGAIEHVLDWLLRWLSEHRGRVFAGSFLLLAMLLPGIGRLAEGTDIIRALKPQAPLRVSTEFIDRHLSGVNSLEVLVQRAPHDTLMIPATIRRVLAFSGWLREQPGVTAVYSPWEPLREVPAELLQQDATLTTLAALLPLEFPLQAWLDPTGQTLRLSARVTAMRSDHFLALAQQVQEQAKRWQLPIQVTGNTYLLAEMSRTLVQTQIQTLGLALLLVLGSIALALRSWRFGLLAAIPNVLPPLMIFGLMGWCGIALSTATTMIASVALGLIVDATIHLIYRYSRERQSGRPPLAAIEQVLHQAGRALIASTLLLTVGFWVGMLGSFRPTVQFSFLIGLTLVFALLADLLLTPALLLTWQEASARVAKRTNG